jgi:hypothetical protein
LLAAFALLACWKTKTEALVLRFFHLADPSTNRVMQFNVATRWPKKRLSLLRQFAKADLISNFP